MVHLHVLRGLLFGCHRKCASRKKLFTSECLKLEIKPYFNPPYIFPQIVSNKETNIFSPPQSSLLDFFTAIKLTTDRYKYKRRFKGIEILSHVILGITRLHVWEIRKGFNTSEACL